MPLYRFVCSQCETDFEELLPRPPGEKKPPCPECASEEVNNVFGLPSVGSTPVRTNCRGDGPPCGVPQCGMRNR